MYWWSRSRAWSLKFPWHPIRLFLYSRNGEGLAFEPGTDEWRSLDVSESQPQFADGYSYLGMFEAKSDQVEYGLIRPWVLCKRFSVNWKSHLGSLVSSSLVEFGRTSFEQLLRSHHRVDERWVPNNTARIPASQVRLVCVYWPAILADAALVVAAGIWIKLIPAAQKERLYERAYLASRSQFCASCGYPRSGLPSGTCPECGVTVRRDTEDSKS